MINLKKIFDDIFIIIAKKQSLFEFLLNLSFVLIIFIIIVVLYWDSINRSIINNGRCKIKIDNSDVTYNLEFYNKERGNTNIFNISYDGVPDKHNLKVDCACPIGETPNNFKVPVYDYGSKKVSSINKFCYCDANYDGDNVNNNIGGIITDNVAMDGDAFLMDYYTGFYASYNKGYQDYRALEFPN